MYIQGVTEIYDKLNNYIVLCVVEDEIILYRRGMILNITGPFVQYVCILK